MITKLAIGFIRVGMISSPAKLVCAGFTDMYIFGDSISDTVFATSDRITLDSTPRLTNEVVYACDKPQPYSIADRIVAA